MRKFRSKIYNYNIKSKEDLIEKRCKLIRELKDVEADKWFANSINKRIGQDVKVITTVSNDCDYLEFEVEGVDTDKLDHIISSAISGQISDGCLERSEDYFDLDWDVEVDARENLYDDCGFNITYDYKADNNGCVRINGNCYHTRGLQKIVNVYKSGKCIGSVWECDLIIDDRQNTVHEPDYSKKFSVWVLFRDE